MTLRHFRVPLATQVAAAPAAVEHAVVLMTPMGRNDGGTLTME